MELFHRSRLPEEKPWAQLTFLHGYGDHGGRMREAMNWFASKGIACYAFDFRGHGRSAGKRCYVDKWSDYLTDLEQWVNEGHLAPDLPTFFLGHSHGGLVLAAAIEDRILKRVDGSIFTSPYLGRTLKAPFWKVGLACIFNWVVPSIRMNSGLQIEWLSSDPAMQEETRKDPLFQCVVTSRWFFTSEFQQRKVLRRAGEFETPLIILCGADDVIASIEKSRLFFKAAASKDKEFAVMLRMRHEILREREREAIFESLLRWIRNRS